MPGAFWRFRAVSWREALTDEIAERLAFGFMFSTACRERPPWRSVKLRQFTERYRERSLHVIANRKTPARKGASFRDWDRAGAACVMASPVWRYRIASSRPAT